MNFFNRLPCSAISHVTTSVDNFHKFAIPEIRVMQPRYGVALILISYEGDIFSFMPIVNNSILSASYFYIFLLVVVFVFSHSIAV